MSDREYLFTSESVTEGHPDKMCDAISDAVLDAIIAREAELAAEGFVSSAGTKADPSYVRGGIETFTTTGQVIVGGEIRTHAYVDIHSIVRGVVDRDRLQPCEVRVRRRDVWRSRGRPRAEPRHRPGCGRVVRGPAWRRTPTRSTSSVPVTRA